MLKKGVDSWNVTRITEWLLFPDLSSADLSMMNLCGVNFDNADLNCASLRRADLSGAHLKNANLTGADLKGAGLVRASFNFAQLAGADLLGAVFGDTALGGVDLSAARGLDATWHDVPSILGVDTILKSGGRIPDIFLRGCGCDPLIQKILVGDGHPTPTLLRNGYPGVTTLYSGVSSVTPPRTSHSSSGSRRRSTSGAWPIGMLPNMAGGAWNSIVRSILKSRCGIGFCSCAARSH